MALLPLANGDVDVAIDKICHDANQGGLWKLRPAKASDLMTTDHASTASAATTTSSPQPTRLVYGIVATRETNDTTTRNEFLFSFCIAYSTWDGRVIYLDCENLWNVSEECERLAFVTLAAIAESLQCTRVAWENSAEHPLRISPPLAPENLDGWLTLNWKREAMEGFLDAQVGSAIINQLVAATDWSDLSDRKRIERCLLDQTAAPKSFRLRLADKSDLSSISRLVQGLADFEKEPDAVNVSVDQYEVDGFSGTWPLFYCLLLESATDNGWYACGMAFCYVGQKSGSTGRFLYLVDLFIESPYRGCGGGKFVMRTLATIGLALDCSLLVWQALYWNTPALTFYKQIGAEVVDGLLTARFKGPALKALRNWEVN